MGRPKYLNNRPEGRSNHRPEGLAKEERRPFSDFGLPRQLERSLRSPACLRTAFPTGRPGRDTTFDSDPASSIGVRKNPAHCSSPTGAIRADWDQPTGDARSERTRERTEKARQGTQIKPRYQGPYPVRLQKQYSATSLTHSVVGADIFPTVLWAPLNSHTVRLPPHASGHEQCCGRRHLPYQVTW